MPVEKDRFNLYATAPDQTKVEVVFSTHMDTVPPFIPSWDDEERIYGRGACDAKGIIAAMMGAALPVKSATAWARRWPTSTRRRDRSFW